MNLICYLTNGNPSIAGTLEMAKTYAASGCDIIEVDLPARDPYLESEYIAGLMASALSRCDDYDCYLKEMEQIKRDNPDTFPYGHYAAKLAYDSYVITAADPVKPNIHRLLPPQRLS